MQYIISRYSTKNLVVLFELSVIKTCQDLQLCIGLLHILLCFELYRNGRSLGEAFTDVRVGQGFAYFPAVSLSIHENVRANFGSTPLHYTLPGYRPLQSPPTIDLIRSRLLLGYLERLVPIMASCCVPKVKHMFSCDLDVITVC